MRNALTIDLEDYYHVSAFRDSVPEQEWSQRESRIERNTALLLDWLDEAGSKATFFILGSVAEQHPLVVRRVADRGHEVACHSLRHRIVYELSPAEFLEDTRTAKKLIEDVSGKPVVGYRAPSFSITAGSFWALSVLAELGFLYDSSIFPVEHANYGIPDASRRPFKVNTPAGSILEFPLTTLEFVGFRSPFGGGAYFRLLPYWYTRWGTKFLNLKEGLPVCVYLHPWEIDPEQPRLSGRLTSRIRHYIGLRNAPNKFRNLIRDFSFSPLYMLAEDTSAFPSAAP